VHIRLEVRAGHIPLRISAIGGLGGLDILVSNAGRQQQAHDSIFDISSEDFDATIETNIYAPCRIIEAALPRLKPGSVIIGTRSEQAYDPTLDLYDYAQTKAATMNYIKSLAKQLGPKRYSRERRGSGAYLDASAGLRRSSMKKLEKFGGQPPGTRRPARGAWFYLRSTCLGRCQLRHWPGLWFSWWLRIALNCARHLTLAS
jgi:hypothetical protein